ncbi:TonB-dependent receptor [Acidisphaera sp. L21]|uniref:TonB-dependent receptor n=1 Tax=Acidisphaera sp. L21 TaxID=1641851 RepID=UPI00131C403A|nr:TonB-dependent receptor [Acidisphaera sp. L21]
MSRRVIRQWGLLACTALTAIATIPARAADPAPEVRLAPDGGLALPEIETVAKRLDAARSKIQPSLGATVYDFGRTTLETLPQGDQSQLQQVLLQAPGVATDSFGQVHIRNEHNNVQYRLDGVQLPEGLSVFGQALETRFAHSVSLITGALPAQYGFRQAGVVDITTKSGTTDPGGQIIMYGGARSTLQPSFEYGGRSGAVDYFVSGDDLHSNSGIENPANRFNANHDTTDQFRGFAHITGLLDDTTRISLLAGSFHGDYQIPNQGGNQPQLGLTVNGTSDFNSATLGEHQRELTQFGILSLQKQWGDVNLQASYFTRYSSLYYTPDPLGDLLFTGVAQTAARSSWANGVQTDASWRVNDRHTLRAGVLAQIERSVGNSNSLVLPVDANGVQTTDTPFALNDSSSKTGAMYGVYLQDEWRILSNVTINYGARFDVVDEYTHDQDASPRVNVVWQATPTTTIHGGYARYFTPPPFELVGNATITKLLGTTAAAATTQDSVAKAERSHYFDAGIGQVIIPGLTVGVDAYYKRAHNLIDEGQFGSPILLTAFNYAKAQQDGVGLSSSYVQGPLSLYGNLAYSRGIGKGITSAQFNFSADELAYISQHYVHLDHDQRWTGSGGAAYTLNDGTNSPTRLSADLLVESGLRRDGATPNGSALPGYYTINLSVVQKLNVFDGRPSELRLDVINLLDRRYEIRDGTGIGVGAAQYGLRRTVLAGLTQRF